MLTLKMYVSYERHFSKRRHYKGIIPLFLCLLLFPVFVFAQKVTVNGQVKDHLGEPVIGANIAIKVLRPEP